MDILSTDNYYRISFLMIATAVLMSSCTPAVHDLSETKGAGHLRLEDSLDRPQDGYCFDIIGSGQHLRFDLPLVAHNCKPGLYADEAVTMEPNRFIRFPVYDKCATVVGINSRALPGAAVVPRDCGEKTPFMDTEDLQKFNHRKDGLIELSGSGLCLTVGYKSNSTFSPEHRWRPLYVESCDKVEPSRSKWKFVIPEK